MKETITAAIGILAIALIALHYGGQPTGHLLRDFSDTEYDPAHYSKPVKIVDYCERVIAPIQARHRALCNTAGTEMCCKLYGIPGCSSRDIAVWPSVCLSKCIEDVRNQCRKAGHSLEREGLQQQAIERTLP